MDYLQFEEDIFKTLSPSSEAAYHIICKKRSGIPALGNVIGEEISKDLSFEDFFKIVYKDIANFSNKADIKFMLSNARKESRRTKKRWYTQVKQTLEKVQKLKSFYEINNSTLSSCEEWSDNNDLLICESEIFESKNSNAQSLALKLDLIIQITTYLSDPELIHKTGETIKRPEVVVNNPLFALNQSRMSLNKNTTGEYTNDYQVSDDYFIRTIISEQDFEDYTNLVPSKSNISINKLKYLDALDARILSYIYAQLPMTNLVQNQRRIVISVRELVLKFMPGTSLYHYNEIKNRLAKLGTYKVCGIHKGSDGEKDTLAFTFSFFNISYLNSDQVIDNSQVRITFDEDFTNLYINQKTIEAPTQLYKLSTHAETIFFPLHYSRLQEIVKYETSQRQCKSITATFNYNFFRSNIILPNRGRKKMSEAHMDLIINAIQELKDNGLLIKDFKRIDKLTIEVEFLSATNKELEALFKPSPLIKESRYKELMKKNKDYIPTFSTY